MTDNEIIKALERMSEEDPAGFSSDILDLIKRQRTEIEKVKNEKVKHHLIYTAVIDEDVLKKVMDERLKKVECDSIKVRNETIKEFAERLKTRVTDIPWCEYPPVHECIDNLVKEMTEGV